MSRSFPLRVATVAALTGCNAAPSSPGVHIAPSTPTTIDGLRLLVDHDAVDPDVGDEVRYRVRWERDGEPVPELDDQWAVAADHTVKGEYWLASVIPSDGSLDGEADRASTTIVNSAPVVRELALPDVITEASVLTAAPSVFDADDDTVTWSTTWFVEGVPIVADELTGEFFDKGDTIWVEASPHDGERFGRPVRSEGVVVRNTVPERPQRVSLHPPDPTAEDDLVCGWDAAVDPDGDTLTYGVTWRRHGAWYAAVDESTPTSTLDHATTAAGDVWTCTVVAQDPDASPSMSSDPATVLPVPIPLPSRP